MRATRLLGDERDDVLIREDMLEMDLRHQRVPRTMTYLLRLVQRTAAPDERLQSSVRSQRLRQT